MVKKIFLSCCVAILLLGFEFQLNAQTAITSADLKTLSKKEDTLKTLSLKIIQGTTLKDRLLADSQFTKVLVRALLTPNSYQYSFDSVRISKLISPDNSFKIFTWQMVLTENMVRQRGAIQMRTTDGKLKLFPLIDKSDLIISKEDTVTNHLNWIGAVYYNIIKTGDYYTLFGFDENDRNSSKKYIEILSFENGLPVFGKKVFTGLKDGAAKTSPARYTMEFKKDAVVKLNYDEKAGLIITEHLVSESNQPNRKWTYVGDGDFDGFKLVNGNWAFVERPFGAPNTSEGLPVPQTIRDDKGNIDETKMKGIAPPPDENAEEEKPANPSPKKKKKK